MRYLADLNIPGHGNVAAPGSIPTGGLEGFFNGARGFMVWAFVIGTVVALFILLHGGYMWITSGGDKSKIQAARNRIIYAIVGLLVVFLSVTIIMMIGTFMGVDLTQNPNP